MGSALALRHARGGMQALPTDSPSEEGALPGAALRP